MPTVIIDGIRYVPAAEIPPLTDERLAEAVRELVSIQHFHTDTRRHRGRAWNALNALAPEVARLCLGDPGAAFDLLNPEEPDADT